MHKNIFSLAPDAHGTLKDMPRSDTFNINVTNCMVQVKKGQGIAQGTVLAEVPQAGGGRLHAPVAGKVSNVDQVSLTITPAAENAVVDVEEMTDMQTPHALLRMLRDMGIDTTGLKAASTLIINALNTEPGLQVAARLMKDFRETLEHGLSLVQRVVCPNDTVLVVPTAEGEGLSDLRVVVVEPVYPNGLSPLIAKSVMGKELPEDVVVLNVDDLYDIGCVAESGLPVTETLMTIGEDTYRVKIGTPVRFIVEYLGIDVHEKDRVILGGPMRGRTLYSLDQGVEKGDRGLFVVPFAAYPPVQSKPCIGCGECIRHCPARLRPDMITRYAEFNLVDKTKGFFIHLCFECGLCAFYCPVHRPMLQYIRLAKDEFASRRTIRAMVNPQD